MPTSDVNMSRGKVDPAVQRRVLAHLREAGERGLAKSKLAELEGISERQITRTFTALTEAGAIITRVNQGGVHFVLEQGPDWEMRIPPEARLALDVALQLVECPGGELWAEPLQRLRDMVDASMGKRDQAKQDHLRAHISAHGTVTDAVPLESSVMGSIFQALAQEPQGELQVDYRDMHGQTSTRTIAPFSLSHDGFSGAIHLLAWDLDKNGARLFRLNRIEAAHLTGKKAIHTHRKELERIRKHKIAGWFADGEPFDVKVRITGGWAQHLREACPDLPEAWVEDVNDETVLLHFKALEHRGPIRILLQFGSEAEVVEPEELRIAVMQEVLALAKKYRASSWHQP